MISSRISKPRTFWGLLVVLGSGLAVWSLASYDFVALGSSAATGVSAIQLESLAYLTLGMLLVGVFASGYGIVRFLSLSGGSGEVQKRSVTIVISEIVTIRRYAMVALFCSVGYAMFFAFFSGILVFQPSVVFSRDYGVGVPSVNVVTCCGTLGQVPEFAIYLTDHIGLLIVPVNLLIMFVVSLLIGFNAGLARIAYDTGRVGHRKSLGLFGAVVGLFTACPTCAGLLLSESAGFSGAFSIVAGFLWVQGILVVIGLLSLIIGLLATARRISHASVCESMSAPRHN